MLTEQQKQNRKNGIGASESGIVLGVNKYISPYQLWMQKTGKMEPDNLSEVPAVKWGSIHEETIAQEYARMMNCEVVEVPETLYHPEYKHILCHLDRKIVGQDKILECKFAMFHTDEWGASGTDIVPLHYIIQVQHQMSVCGASAADLAVLIGGWDYRVYHFKRDEFLIGKIIADLNFFWDCVIKDIAPPLRDRNDVQLAYPRPRDFYKEADGNVIATIDTIKMLKSQIKKLDEQKEKLEDDLTLFLGDCEGLKINNQVAATWKANKNGVRTLRLTEQRA